MQPKIDDVNIRISRATYKRLKIRAAKFGKNLKATVDILSRVTVDKMYIP